jgi:hypothetical protein
MIDRLVHHAEVIALKGDSYRLKNREVGRVPAAITEENQNRGVSFRLPPAGQFSAAVDRHAADMTRVASDRRRQKEGARRANPFATSGFPRAASDSAIPASVSPAIGVMTHRRFQSRLYGLS